MTVHLNPNRGRVLDASLVLNLPDVALVSTDDELVRNLPAPSLRRILLRVITKHAVSALVARAEIKRNSK